MKTVEDNKLEKKISGRETPDIPAMVKVMHPEAKKMLREAFNVKKTSANKKKSAAKPAKKTAAKKTAKK